MIYSSCIKRTTAKVFTSGRSQAVRIPKQYRFTCGEVFIEREGDRIVLTPRPSSWKDYFDTRPPLPADYPDALADPPPQEVEAL